MIVIFLLIGSLLAVLTVDRVSHIIHIIPWLFDLLFYFIFPKNADSSIPNKKYKNIYKIEAKNYPLVDENLNRSINELMEKIFSMYVLPISNSLNLSYDINLQLRKIVRDFLSSIYLRSSDVDLDHFIRAILIPKLLEHLLFCKKMHDEINRTIDPLSEKTVFRQRFPSGRIHAGLSIKGKEENAYLEALSESILNIALPEIETYSRPLILLLRSILCTYILIPIVDYLSNSENLNYLLYCSIINEPCQECPQKKESEYLVPILHEFENIDSAKYLKIETPPKVFMLTWKQLQSSSSLFYVFMQVLKLTPAFRFPHFCLTIEGLCKKIGDFGTETDRIHHVSCHEILNEALHLYQSFLTPSSFDYINLPEDLAQKFDSFDFELETPENIKTLTNILNCAYAITFDLIRMCCLDMFYRTPEFFLLCVGDRPRVENQISSFHKFRSKKEYTTCFTNLQDYQNKNLDDKDDDDTLSQPIDFLSLLSEDEHLSDTVSAESSNIDHSSANIDVSNWIVEIKSLKNAWKKNSKIVQFIIVVMTPAAVNNMPIQWEVARQYKEFYGLENRLRRFHGGKIIATLPPKRSILYKNYDFFTSCKKPFQEFIQSLLKISYLKHSNMLYAFLTKDNLGSASYFAKTIAIDTGRALQSVIGTLSTEKGKYIDNFMINFASSTEPVKPKGIAKRTLAQLKQKYSFLSEPTTSTNNIGHIRCWINYDETSKSCKQILQSFCQILRPIKIIELSLHLSYTLFGGIAELFFQRWMKENVKRITTPNTISNLIDTFTAYICSINEVSSRPKLSTDEIADMLYKKIPPTSSLAIREASMKTSIKTIIQLFQSKLFNRQLIFTLLDETIAKLFPELTHKKQPKNILL